MKSFSEFLMESKKQYAFRVKLACECSKEDMAALKVALDKYKVAAISEPKGLPIATTHSGFEHLTNIPITIIDILTDYPANPVQIREMIRDTMGVAESHIMVRTPGEEANAMPVVQQKEAVLDKDYEKAKEKSMLVDLDAVFKDHESIEYPFAAETEADGKTTESLPVGKDSPIGSKKVHFAKVKK